MFCLFSLDSADRAVFQHLAQAPKLAPLDTKLQAPRKVSQSVVRSNHASCLPRRICKTTDYKREGCLGFSPTLLHTQSDRLSAHPKAVSLSPLLSTFDSPARSDLWCCVLLCLSWFFLQPSPDPTTRPFQGNDSAKTSFRANEQNISRTNRRFCSGSPSFPTR